MSWSFDDKYIGIFFSPEALVLEVQNPGTIYRIQGADCQYIGKGEILFTQGNDIYYYNFDSEKREIFINDASKPAFLWGGNLNMKFLLH